MAIRAPHGHHGYSSITDPDRPTLEFDTAQCGHCGAVLYLKPGCGITVYMIPQITMGIIHYTEEAGAFCRVCMRAVCLDCHDKGICLPLEKQLELMEAAGRAR